MIITQADIARQLGVSAMTVSMALRNHPRISPVMCLKVQDAARKLGYRADPLLSHWGGMRWKRSRPGFRGVLAYISSQESPETTSPVLWEAQSLAGQLGYEMQPFCSSEKNSPDRLGRQLYHRGIRGVLIERVESQPFLETFPWDRLAAVECNYGYSDFPCHRVGLERYNEVVTAWKKAVETGHRRIGLVLLQERKSTDRDTRIGAMDYCQQHLFSHLPRLPLTMAPGWSAPDAAIKQLRSMIQRQRPDALLLFNGFFVHLCRAINPAILKGTSLINLMLQNQQGDESGLLEDPKIVARTSVHLLDSMLRTGQIGRPESRQVILMAKPWVDGNTLIDRTGAPRTK
jgi:LacI family transcriptional regulator